MASSFGEILRTIREHRRLTQRQLAERAQMSRTEVGNIERGTRPDPRWSTVVRLADALNVPTDAFRDEPETEI